MLCVCKPVSCFYRSLYSQIVRTILSFHRAEDAAFSVPERELFVQFCTVFLEDLTPYLNRCLQVLFPPAQRAQLLGVTATQLSRYGSLGSIDVTVLQEALEGILPQKEPVLLSTQERDSAVTVQDGSVSERPPHRDAEATERQHERESAVGVQDRSVPETLPTH
ncbi:hypothetical protein FKM82_003744 [Ascaphus truei]